MSIDEGIGGCHSQTQESCKLANNFFQEQSALHSVRLAWCVADRSQFGVSPVAQCDAKRSQMSLGVGALADAGSIRLHVGLACPGGPGGSVCMAEGFEKCEDAGLGRTWRTCWGELEAGHPSKRQLSARLWFENTCEGWFRKRRGWCDPGKGWEAITITN